MIVLHRYAPKGKFVPLHDIDFYRRFDIIAIIQDYANAHKDNKRLQDKAAKAIAAIKNDCYYILSTTD